MACALNMPSVFTATLSIETTPKHLDEQDRLIDEIMRANGSDANNQCMRRRIGSQIMNNKKSVMAAALSIGVVGVVSGFILNQSTGIMDHNWPVFGTSSPYAYG